jgi:HEAT repeat protein
LALLLALPAAAVVDNARCDGLLRQALTARNPETRKMAVVALSLAANEDPLLDRLAGMLDDKDVEVRLAVVASLAEVNGKNATAALEKALQDEVPEVSFAAAKALYARHAPNGKAALLSVLQGDSKTSSSFFTKQKRDALRMMHTPRTTFLYAMRQGMGFVPVPGLGEGIASMQALLTDAGVSGRASAALLLGKDKDPATIDALRDSLYDKDWHVRAAAVHSLVLQNDPALKADLEPLVDDDREEVRLRAAAGWLRLAALQKRPAQKRTARAPEKKK